ncbi:angiogenic factor with G patch and FHA domains 1 isoform X2 [Chironomus tepperi]|uniref:angiogenic factor with G patch and FHA domains 1 isoform X2 n=1 Tax=Chironomus tepperi TaxID=113505 RepID=UPI00391F832E
MRKIKRNTKYFKVTDFLSLNVKDVFIHIQKLYSKITSQKKKIKKLQLKIKKLEFLSKLDAHINKTQQDELKDEKIQQKQTVDKSTKREENVADFINEIKSQAMMNAYEQAGFIYEPTSGLYWDSKTGYYYNPQTDLYYDGNKGTWHRLNPITNEFTFHSETEAAKAVKKVQQNSIDSLINDFKTLEIKNLQKHALEIAKKYPPSLRLIVLQSNVSSISMGKLFLVTFKGGTLGREGDHEVLLTAENVSKEHLRFTYNNKKKVYQFVDKSRNGTLLNGREISLLRKEECEPQSLHHGDTLEIAHIKLLAHIHEGLQTCDECEPFNYAQKPQEQPVKPVEEFVPSLSHKEQLKLLQKRYGLESDKYQEKQPGTNNKNYEDRASQRRMKVGSSHDHEKTVQASVDKSISSENKGFKLLSKMGWNEGSSLGKSDSGIKEPVQLKTQQGTSGLGLENVSKNPSQDGMSNKKKQEIWSKTQDRYNKLRKDDDN